ncbi:suppressor of cytokine signaling 1a [Brienomyrus brachyistius]|uniref:suppressor of cytokine signaling 1a n=1 Tax=Brienomyrus brachyistius TaxID=42636 RepID=UPI0020B32718|nr:suppressor of cytokine signaling 1a [Brienomyrus brachyistius]
MTTQSGLFCRMVEPINVERNEAEERDRVQQLADNIQPIRHRPDSRECQTHFPLFRNQNDFSIISMTTSKLEESGFYWHSINAEKAQLHLKDLPVGSFLIRDSSRKDYFFTLSYKSSSGPVNIRISFQGSRFSLNGSKETFDSLFKLLEHYVKKKILTKPCRRVKVQSLQELCRKRIIETWGAQKIESIPLAAVHQKFLKSFPYPL